MYSRLLKLILTVATFGWGISILGALLPWSTATAGLSGLGAGPIPYDPMLEYWMRMVGGGFTMIGAIFAAVLIRPAKYGVLVPLLAWLSIAEGVILLANGLRLGLGPFPLAGDVSFCIGIGLGLLVVYPRATEENTTETPLPPPAVDLPMMARKSQTRGLP